MATALTIVVLIIVLPMALQAVFGTIKDLLSIPRAFKEGYQAGKERK